MTDQEETDIIYLYSGWQCIEEREFDENGEPGEGDDAWEPRRQYVYGGQYIDEPLFFVNDLDDDGVFYDSPGTGSQRYYYCHNANFNVVAVVKDDNDNTASVVERIKYDPYGEATIWSQSEVTDNPYLFQGRRWDDDVDLYYFRNRWYTPRLGRFLQRDPKGYVDGMNLYEFVGGRPVQGLDPYGLWLFPIPIVWLPEYLRPVNPYKDDVKEFINCDGQKGGLKLTDVQKAAIRSQVKEGCSKLRDMLRILSWTPGETQDVFKSMPDRLRAGLFEDPEGRKGFRNLIQKAIDRACDGVEIECHCPPCPEGSNIDAYTVAWDWSNIHICPDFFEKNDSSTQYSIILWELTRYGGADDGESGKYWKHVYNVGRGISGAIKRAKEHGKLKPLPKPPQTCGQMI